MANKNNTREDIHSGLSQSKSDEKWSDMLNFRSNDNRTFAVPRKLGMLQYDAGLHTVLHGVGDLNYAIGSKKSFVFRSHDGTEFKPLWQARLERVTTTQDQSENLLVRGSYLGDAPINIRVSLLDGLLVLDKDWPQEPEVVEEEPEPMPELNCNVSSSSPKFKFNLIVTKDGLPIKSTNVTILQGTFFVGKYSTNANGLLQVALDAGTYRVKVMLFGFESIYQNFTIADSDITETVNFVSIYPGLQISVRYSNTLGPVPGGHTCDSAIYKLLGNGVLIGIVNLNNAVDGGDREVNFTIGSVLAKALAKAEESRFDRIKLSLVCDPTQPGFDLISWLGTCHTSLAWVIVKSAANVELYNGAPTGSFFTAKLQ